MHRGIGVVAVLAALLVFAGEAGAAVPDPSSYFSASQLSDVSVSSSWTFDTTTGAINGGATRPAGTGVMNGIGFQIDPSSGMAVFDFGSLTVPSGVTIVYSGTHPLGLLSTGNITIAGQIHADGLAPAGGAGAGSAGTSHTSSPAGASGGGGASFGGAGSAGAPVNVGFTLPGGAAGPTYGSPDVSVSTVFPTGSSGGSGATCSGSGTPAAGGAGGGGVAIVALGSLDLSGAIVKAQGSTPAAVSGSSGGGGGSGGAALVVAPRYTDTSSTELALWGGAGGPAGSGCTGGAGGSGGGGRLTLMIDGSSQAVPGPPPSGGLSAATTHARSFLSLDGPASGVVGVAVSGFTATPAIGQLSSTSWSWGDGSTSSGPTHTYSAAGTYTVTATSTMAGSGTTTSASQTITITDTLDHIGLSPTSSTVAAGDTQAYTANGFDSSGASVGDRTAQTSFSISPSGPGTGASCSANACGATLPGNYTITGDDGGKTSQATLRVTTGPLDHLVLSPATATIFAGTKQPYTAVGFDRFGNSVGDVTSQTSFAISPGSGFCAGAACSASDAGTYTVTGMDGSARGTARLTVQQKPPAKSPPPDAPKIGTPKLNPSKGTAKLVVKVPQAGKLVLKGPGIKQVHQRVAAGARATLVITPAKAVATRLKQTKHATVKLTLVFTPDQGKVFTRKLTVTLRRR